jgi:glycosyltransferase involved in cell wall biosynthesis
MRNFSIDDITFVVIGRNEAPNLSRCFVSIKEISSNIIFVDSDSSDSSLEIAKTHGISKIVELRSNHYSAGLGRFAGAELVETRLIQFIDGDQTIEADWPSCAVEFLNKNEKAAVVHGYKKEFKINYEDFTIKSDKKDHRPDYLQGSFCVVKEIYTAAGGFDFRFIGQEERDLYIRIHSMGHEVWYHHALMASHFDFKERGIRYLFLTDISVMVLVFLIKAVSTRNFTSYLYVYRRIIPFLPIELASFMLLVHGLLSNSLESIAYVVTIQLSALIYAKRISRIGYFIIWKAALLNMFRVPRVMKTDVSYETNITDMKSAK